MSALLCLVSFALCFWAGSRSLVKGLAALLAVGYVYGIVRANLPETFSHFIYDAGVLGLYLSLWLHPIRLPNYSEVISLKSWTAVLVLWPVIIFFVPLQDPLIQLVGLRGAIFLLPFLLIGAGLKDEDIYKLALWLAVFNLIACAFAGAEFFMGMERFFPKNEVTRIIYQSNDVTNSRAYRIPAIFANAHAYAGTMVATMPLLFGAVFQKQRKLLYPILLALGLTAALLGVFISATRTNFIAAAILIIVGTFSIRSKYASLLGWLLILSVIGWLVSGEGRLQRFTTLLDTDLVRDRLSISINMNLWEVITKYPFGNGLGGGGTSIPYFLRDRLINPITIENNYAAIAIEQGFIGLVLWILFILWFFTRKVSIKQDPWRIGRNLIWYSSATSFALGLIGIGLFTAVPQTSLLLLSMGWMIARPSVAVRSHIMEHEGRTFKLRPAESDLVASSKSTVV